MQRRDFLKGMVAGGAALLVDMGLDLGTLDGPV